MFGQHFEAVAEDITANRELTGQVIAETDGKYKQELSSLLTLKFQTFENVNL